MSESRFNWTIALLLLLACSLAYINTLDGEWVWDDSSSVLLHKHVQQPGKTFLLFSEDQHAFGRGQGNFYRPLVASSFMLDYYFSGGPSPDDYAAQTLPEISPFLFHLSNIFWHLSAALLLLLLLHFLKAPRFVRGVTPLLFVVHPLHTEAVAYISGRADMMSAAAIFAALCFSVTAIQHKRPVGGTIGAVLCFIAGLLSKESTLIYPILLGIIFLTVRTKRNTLEKTAIQEEKIPFYLRFAPLLSAASVLVLYLLLRSTVLNFANGSTVDASPLPHRLFETMQSLGLYAKMLFFPIGLHMERSLDGVPSVYALFGILFLLSLIAGIALSWYSGRKRIAAGFAWFLASWLPISGIFPLNAPLAEHWMYVPMAGFWWAFLEIIWELCKDTRRIKIAYTISLILCILFIAMTAQRNREWHDNETLFRATLRENPNTIRVHYNLAVTYDNIQRNYAGARRHYEYYIKLRDHERAAAGVDRGTFTSDDIEVRMSLGRLLLQSGEYLAAFNTLAPLKQLAKIEAWRPTAALAALQTGQALLALGDIGQAHHYFQEAVTIDPNLATEVELQLSGQPFGDNF
ncbi:MAG: hypothetical protein KAH38_03140 [Candidatus Hydrogenedentes bacterium]|nr:hypothetical protein [Candidatus Hydrogenedentota bacterium]